MTPTANQILIRFEKLYVSQSKLNFMCIQIIVIDFVFKGKK